MKVTDWDIDAMLNRKRNRNSTFFILSIIFHIKNKEVISILLILDEDFIKKAIPSV